MISCMVLQGLPLMVADVRLDVVKFNGLSVERVDGWHLSQPSLTCDDDGVVTVDCLSVVEAIVASWGCFDDDQLVEQVWEEFEQMKSDFSHPLP